VTGIALPGGPIRITIPRYSETIEAAMQVVEKMGHEAFNSVAKAVGLATLSIHQYPDGT
jgi:hypothetical protein